MSTENTYKNLPEKERQEIVMKEMVPYFLYAIIPVIITIIIAKVFGPSVY